MRVLRLEYFIIIHAALFTSVHCIFRGIYKAVLPHSCNSKHRHVFSCSLIHGSLVFKQWSDNNFSELYDEWWRSFLGFGCRGKFGTVINWDVLFVEANCVGFTKMKKEEMELPGKYNAINIPVWEKKHSCGKSPPCERNISLSNHAVNEHLACTLPVVRTT